MSQQSLVDHFLRNRNAFSTKEWINQETGTTTTQYCLVKAGNIIETQRVLHKGKWFLIYRLKPEVYEEILLARRGIRKGKI